MAVSRESPANAFRVRGNLEDLLGYASAYLKDLATGMVPPGDGEFAGYDPKIVRIRAQLSRYADINWPVPRKISRPNASRVSRVAIVALVATAACGDPSVDEASATQRYDSAGVAVVVSDAPPLIRVLAASPRASIGVASGDSAYLLADVSGASLLDDGRIVIANCLPPLLRWYDTSGAYLMGAGREGEGPTEFPKGACARLFGISALTNGRVETWEHTHHRLRVFDSLGTQVSTRVLAAKSLAPGPEFLGKFERGYLMGEYPGRVHQHYFSGLDSWRDTLVMHAFGEDGDYEGIIGRTAGWPFTRTVLPTRFGPRGAVVLVPFAPLGMAAPWGPTVAVGDGSGPEVRVLDRGGKLTTIIRWKAERIAVTDSLIEILIDEAVSLETEGPSYKKTTREAFEAHPYPDTARSYSRLLVGRDGLLWVRQFSPPGATSATWLAFAASGSLVAAMDQPSGTTVLEIGDDYLLLLVENSLGVESVVLHDITELNPKRSDR